MLEHIRVRDVMHHGILSCSGEAPLREVAAVMARHHVHAVAIRGGDSLRPIGVVSDLDVVAAVASGDEQSALQAAAMEPLTVSAEESIHRAAQLMAENFVTHLVVKEGASDYPIGSSRRSTWRPSTRERRRRQWDRADPDAVGGFPAGQPRVSLDATGPAEA